MFLSNGYTNRCHFVIISTEGWHKNGIQHARLIGIKNVCTYEINSMSYSNIPRVEFRIFLGPKVFHTEGELEHDTSSVAYVRRGKGGEFVIFPSPRAYT